VGGVVGVVSSKFLFATIGLLLSSRVNLYYVRAWVNPASSVTAISEGLATKLDKLASNHQAGSVVRLKHPMTIGLGTAEFDVESLPVTDDPLPVGVDLVLGQDMLASHVLDIDFRRSRIRLVLKSEYQGVTRHMAGIVLTPDHGLWRLSAGIDGSPQSPTLLDLASPHAVSGVSEPGPVTIAIGDIKFKETDLSPPSTATDRSELSIGLRAFLGEHIVLDLPHNRIWLERGPQAPS
jgi:hypothetical protein